MASRKNLALNLPQVRKKNMNRKQEYETRWWTGDLRRFELLHLHLFDLLFNKECVHGYILATTVHFLPPCICHLHATFQEMIFSNSSSDVERIFGEIFLCIFGKSYILVNVDKVLSVCSTSKQEAENRWKCFKQTTDPHARIFCTQQCF